MNDLLILDELITFLHLKDYADYKFYEMSDLIKIVEEFKAEKVKEQT